MRRPHLLRWGVLWLCLLAAPLASAQQIGQSDLDVSNWLSLAQRAENAIDAGRASDEALEAVRADLVLYRQAFLGAVDTNTARIATVQAQLDALGPVVEGEEDPPTLAAQRTELTRRLQELRAPGLAAEAAFSRADGLVGQIDRVLADRRTDALLRLGVSPLNPALWAEAAGDLVEALQDVRAEFRRNWSADTTRAQLQGNLPLIGVLVGLGLVLLTRGRRWAERAGDAMRRFGGRGTGVWTLMVSLGRIALPVAGLFFLTQALFASGLVGVRGTLLIENIPLWGALLLGLRWLCERLFSKRADDALIPFAPERRAELRLYGTTLAALYVAHRALILLLGLENASEASSVVLSFPLLVLAGLILFRLGQILVTAPKLAVEDEDGQTPLSPGFARILKLLGQGAIAVAVVAPLLGAVGYSALSRAILHPTAMSLALFGIVTILQRFIADLYALISNKPEGGREALVPAIIGLLLVLAALPVLALIWGVRPSELLELWVIFNEGFQLGETRISPTDFLAFAVIFSAGYMATRLFQGALKNSLLPKTRIDPGGQTAIVSGTGYLGIFLAAMIAIMGAGIDLSALAIVFGALSVGIGFGLQNIVSNFVSGIILLIERPIAEGDWIEVNGSMGYVRSISVRATRIETFDRTDVIVPNADFISGTVTNYTRGNTIGRVIVPVGVAYGTDTKRVEAILQEIAEAHPMVLASPPPAVIFQGFGADSLDFEIRGILRDVNWVLSVKSDLNHEIARRFIEEGIEIPFAQRDIWLRNPEALRGPQHPEGEAE